MIEQLYLSYVFALKTVQLLIQLGTDGCRLLGQSPKQIGECVYVCAYMRERERGSHGSLEGLGSRIIRLSKLRLYLLRQLLAVLADVELHEHRTQMLVHTPRTLCDDFHAIVSALIAVSHKANLKRR